MIRILEAGSDLQHFFGQLPKAPRIWVCAPHPDDFDAIAVTLRRLEQSGAVLFLSVAGSGASGVEDVFAAAGKGAVREAEQLDSCRLFGLPSQRVRFLRMTENAAGELADTPENPALLAAAYHEFRPDVIALPHGNDTNADHRLIFRSVKSIAPDTALLLNKDPKTIELRIDLATLFDEEEARWKASLLLCHRSQDARNRRTRGYGFDHRILAGNKADAETICRRFDAYAELFEVFVKE